MSSCGTKPTRLSLRKSVRVLLFTLTVPVASPSAPRPGTAVSQTQLRATPAYIYTSRVSPPPCRFKAGARRGGAHGVSLSRVFWLGLGL